jgi:hypothetical protein
MDHINEERLFELAIDEQSEPSREEASHLQSCRICSARLAEERSLTASLEAMPQVAVPVGFAMRTAEMFARAKAKKVSFAPTIIIGVVAASLITSFMLWLMIANPSFFVTQMALAVGKAAVFVKTMILVASRVPYGAEVATTFSGAIVLISAALLSGLLKRAWQVK